MSTEDDEPIGPADLPRIFETLSPSDLMTAMMRDRPYDGQPHTDTGWRGTQEVHGLTMRDIRDCFIIGCFEASGLAPEEYPTRLYDLLWREMDPLAVCQNMMCNIEKRMGIFPNLPPEMKRARKDGSSP